MNKLELSTHNSIADFSAGQWNNVVRPSDTGSIFQSYEWISAFESVTTATPRHLVVKKGNNPVGICPGFIKPVADTPIRRYSSAAAGFGGPIVVGDEGAVLDRLLEGVNKICGGRTIGHIIKSSSQSHLKYAQQLYNAGYRPDLRNCRFEIQLTEGWEKLLENMDSSKRRTITKIDSNKYAKESTLEGNVSEFYPRYEANLKRVDGDGLSKSHLTAIAESCGDIIKMLTAYKGDEIIGQFVFLIDDIRNTIQHFLSGINPENFSANPAEVLHKQMIQWGIDEDYDTYDFGGTAADFDDGIFRFKSEFGGKIMPTVKWKKGHSRIVWSLYQAAKRQYTGG